MKQGVREAKVTCKKNCLRHKKKNFHNYFQISYAYPISIALQQMIGKGLRDTLYTYKLTLEHKPFMNHKVFASLFRKKLSLFRSDSSAAAKEKEDLFSTQSISISNLFLHSFLTFTEDRKLCHAPVTRLLSFFLENQRHQYNDIFHIICDPIKNEI